MTDMAVKIVAGGVTEAGAVFCGFCVFGFNSDDVDLGLQSDLRALFFEGVSWLVSKEKDSAQAQKREKQDRCRSEPEAPG